MTTAIRYNGITIWGCVLREFVQETLPDDSQTDAIAEKFRITVSGYIHGQNYSSGPSHAPKSGAYASTNLVEIRHALLMYRRPFQLLVGAVVSGGEIVSGQILLEANPSESSRKLKEDLNNGPKPLSLKVTHVASNNVFRVEYSIEVVRLECDDFVSSDVLNNRWSMTDTYDQNFYCTREINGLLRVRSAIVNAHSFRGVVVPRLEPGFRRDRMSFTSTEDGLHLRYQIIDKSIAYAPPAPATKWHVAHAMGIDEARKTTSHISVTLIGPRTADQRDLFAIAGAVVDAKLFNPAVGVPGKSFTTTSYEMISTNSDDENRVEVRASAIHFGAALTDVKAITRAVVHPINPADIPGYQWTKATEPPVNGDMPITKAFSAYLQDPCSSKHGFVDAPRADTSQIEDTQLTNETSQVVPSSEYLTNPILSVDNADGLYVTHEQDVIYEFLGTRLHLPVAKSGTSSGSAAQSGDDWVSISVTPNGCRMTIRIVAKRMNKAPKLPAPIDYEVNGYKFSLLRYTIAPTETEVMADGTRLYTTRGEYYYGLNKAPPPNGQLAIPPVPWNNSPDTLTGYEMLTGSNSAG